MRLYHVAGDELPAHFNGRRLEADTVEQMRKYLLPSERKPGRVFRVRDPEGRVIGTFNHALNFNPVAKKS